MNANSLRSRPHLGWAASLVACVVIASTGVAHAQTGVYTLDAATAAETGQTYAATATDESAIYVLNQANLTLTDCTMTKTGDASDIAHSDEFGVNAGVLADSGGSVALVGGSVTTNAVGAGGLFASGAGSSISMANGTLETSGISSPGVSATHEATATLTDVDVTTHGSSATALDCHDASGQVSVTGGTIMATADASRSHAFGIYSAGLVTVTDATVSSGGDCGGLIDGAATIALTNASLTGALHGIKIWSAAATEDDATVTMEAGSLTAQNGDAIFVSGQAGSPVSAAITLSASAAITASTGRIIHVMQASSANVVADAVSLTGDFVADDTSQLDLTLQSGTTLFGVVSGASLHFADTSQWTVTDESHVAVFEDAGGISGTSVTNVTGNGNTVYYDDNLPGNADLGGLTYDLVNGGTLRPEQAQPVESTDWGTVKSLFANP